MLVTSIGNQFNVNKTTLKKKTDNRNSNISITNKINNIISPAYYFNIHRVSFGNTDIDNSRFLLPIGCEPDKYQIESAESLERGDNTLVTAPTGTGKTAIAHYVLKKNFDNGVRTFYTTPLKALSNQKYSDFKKLFGENNVGILTGDRKENASAPIVVMTTEIYRNMVSKDYFGKQSDNLRNLKTVVFDEFHFMGDPSRGSIWEESVMFTPSKTQILALSATIGNNTQIADWFKNIKNNCNLVDVPSENRHVPLKFMIYHPGSRSKTSGHENSTINVSRLLHRLNSSKLTEDEATSLDNLNKVINQRNSQESIYDEFYRKSKVTNSDVLRLLAHQFPNDALNVSLFRRDLAKMFGISRKVADSISYEFTKKNMGEQFIVNPFRQDISKYDDKQKQMLEVLAYILNDKNSAFYSSQKKIDTKTVIWELKSRTNSEILSAEVLSDFLKSTFSINDDYASDIVANLKTGKNEINISVLEKNEKSGTLTEEQNQGVFQVSKLLVKLQNRKDLLLKLEPMINGETSLDEFVNILVKQYDIKKETAYKLANAIKSVSVIPVDAQVPVKNIRKTFSQRTSDVINLIEDLHNDEKLPAIAFVLSKKYSEELLNQSVKKGALLTSDEEREEIKQILDKYKNELGLYSNNLNEKALLKGYAIHSAAILPLQKQMIEELFNKKLVKVVFATETLSAGINMPAKSVVMTGYMKPTSEKVKGNEMGAMHLRELNANEFHQMSGRAGRRGIDTEGYVYLISYEPKDDLTYKTLINSEPDKIPSRFNTDASFVTSFFDMTTNLSDLKYVIENSFSINSVDERFKNKKIHEHMSLFLYNTKLLADNGFIDVTKAGEKINTDIQDIHSFLDKQNIYSYSTTPNGTLINEIKGKPQIPIVKSILNKTYSEKMTPAEWAGLIGAMVVSPRIPVEIIEKYKDSTLNKLGIGTHIYNKLVADFNSYNDSVAQIMETSSVAKKMPFAELNPVAFNIVSTWAMLNAIEPTYQENWNILCDMSQDKGLMKYEGDIFNAVSQTIDFIHQIEGVLKKAMKLSENKEDIDYYSALLEKSKEAVKLIQCPPLYSVEEISSNEVS